MSDQHADQELTHVGPHGERFYLADLEPRAAEVIVETSRAMSFRYPSVFDAGLRFRTRSMRPSLRMVTFSHLSETPVVLVNSHPLLQKAVRLASDEEVKAAMTAATVHEYGHLRHNQTFMNLTIVPWVMKKAEAFGVEVGEFSRAFPTDPSPEDLQSMDSGAKELRNRVLSEMAPHERTPASRNVFELTAWAFQRRFYKGSGPLTETVAMLFDEGAESRPWDWSTPEPPAADATNPEALAVAQQIQAIRNARESREDFEVSDVMGAKLLLDSDSIPPSVTQFAETLTDVWRLGNSFAPPRAELDAALQYNGTDELSFAVSMAKMIQADATRSTTFAVGPGTSTPVSDSGVETTGNAASSAVVSPAPATERASVHGDSSDTPTHDTASGPSAPGESDGRRVRQDESDGPARASVRTWRGSPGRDTANGLPSMDLGADAESTAVRDRAVRPRTFGDPSVGR